MPLRSLVFAGLLVACCSVARGADGLYSIRSKSQGADFDLTVTEIRREANKSFLSVPGFHDRTARAARWLMCVYTDLALKRGFSYRAVTYPPPGEDVIVVGLTNSPTVSPRELLGEDYNEHTLGETTMPIEKTFPMCGFGRYPW